MILLRSVLGKWQMRMPQYVMSTMKKATQLKEPQLPNPFKNKTYEQLNRIISLNISRKNEIIVCSLVLSAALERMSLQHSKKQEISTTQKENKQQLMNKTIQKMLAKLNELTPKDILLIIKIVLSAYGNRYFKLSNINKEMFQNELQNQLSVQVEEDRTGQHKEVFKEVLFSMLEAKKRIFLLKQIIDYLIIHDLKTNEDIINFFDHFSSHNRTGYYNASLEPVLENFMAKNADNLDKTSEWVEPRVLETIFIFTDKLRIEGSPYFKQFLVGLEHELKSNNISLGHLVLYFKHLLEWAQWSSAYFLTIKEIDQGVELIYRIMKNLKQRIQQGQKEERFNEFLELIVMVDKFREFTKFAHQILKVTQIQLLREYHSLIQLIFSVQLIPKFHLLEPEHMVQIITYPVDLPKSLNRSLALKFIYFLDQHQCENNLITRLRIYEYLTKLIIEKKVDLDISLLLPLIKKIENKSHKLRDYEIIRIRNVLKLLEVESAIIDNLFRELINKKQTAIIENLARTSLKEYSIEEIQKYSRILLKKRENEKKSGHKFSGESTNQSSIRNSLWSSLKKVKSENTQENIDPIFLFWVHKNDKFFKEITKDYKNCYLILSNAIKEFNLGSKAIDGSVNYQILFQVLKSWYSQNPQPKPEEYRNLVADNLRNFLQSENISSIFENQFRHSFYVKVLWSYQILAGSPSMKESYMRRFRQIHQVLLLAKSLKLNLYRQKKSIKAGMLKLYLNSLQTHQNVKLRQINMTVEPWFWANYHQVPQFNQTVDAGTMDKIEKYIKNRYGHLFLAEYLAGTPTQGHQARIQGLIKNSPLFRKLYEGNLGHDCEIDEQSLLDSALLTCLLSFMFKRHPQCCDVYLRKLVNLQCSIPYEHIINIANQVQKFRSYLQVGTVRMIKNRLKQIILAINPNDNPSIIPFYIKFNISKPAAVQIVSSYILKELRSCNFHIAQLLYINGYEDQNDNIEFLMDITYKNRVLQFLDIFHQERIVLVSGFLGLSLNQTKRSVLETCVQIFVEFSCLHSLSNSVISELGVILEYYMLLQVAISKFTTSQPEHKTLSSAIAQMKRENQNIDTNLLESLRKSTCQMIPKQMRGTLEVNPSTLFPMWDNKMVIIDREQPGYTKLVAQYFRIYHNINDILIVSEDQIDLKLVKQVK